MDQLTNDKYDKWFVYIAHILYLLVFDIVHIW